MQILSAAQQKYLDRFTIENEPISSVDLMNRAASVFTDKFLNETNSRDRVVILCGTGNNGGDGFAVFRLLKRVNIDVSCYLIPFGTMTGDCRSQYELVRDNVLVWSTETKLPAAKDTIIIDALLGIGSNREPENELKQVIEWANTSGCLIYSVDMPSGMPTDELPSHDCIIKATKTFTFHAPKLTFFLPETADFAGEWEVLDIGLDQTESNKLGCKLQLAQADMIRSLIPKRKRFSHKGTYGHALLIAGSDGKMGACLLSAEAALHSGIGLLTIHTVLQAKHFLHQRIPEAMVYWDINENELSGDRLPDPSDFSAIGIGPGTGISKGVRLALEQALSSKRPCVIDADALNILSAHPELLEKLHENCVLTPHPKEFERLAGPSGNSLDRMARALDFSKKYSCVLVLKDAITAMIDPGGSIVFNSTGNPGMAKGGSGDVLTGIILGCLTQGIKPFDAARIAVYHHGLAGDQAKIEKGERSMLASDLIRQLRIE